MVSNVFMLLHIQMFESMRLIYMGAICISFDNHVSAKRVIVHVTVNTSLTKDHLLANHIA